MRSSSARADAPAFLTTGWAGLAAAVALLLGGPPVIWTTAFVVTACIDRLGRLLGRWGVAPFFLQMVGGLVATVSMLGLFAVGALPPATEPSLVIAASITVLLSGLSVMSAVQDAISGHPVTAAGRAAEIASLSAGLLTGVILGLKMGIEFRLTLDPAEPVAADLTRFGISTFGAAAAAAMFALACYAPLRSLTAAALAGGIGWDLNHRNSGDRTPTLKRPYRRYTMSAVGATPRYGPEATWTMHGSRGRHTHRCRWQGVRGD